MTGVEADRNIIYYRIIECCGYYYCYIIQYSLEHKTRVKIDTQLDVRTAAYAIFKYPVEHA